MPFDLSAYEPVEDRIRQFWTDHPDGAIQTDLVSDDGQGGYIVKATVHPDLIQFPTTGYAHDSAAQLPSAMKASALEVCETSAVGRALANLGYAPKGRRPSREEMSKTSPARASKARGGATPAPAGDTPLGGGGATGEGVTPPSDDVRAAMSNYLALCEDADLKPLQTYGKALKRAVKTDDLLHTSLADLELAIAYVAQTLLRAEKV